MKGEAVIQIVTTGVSLATYQSIQERLRIGGVRISGRLVQVCYGDPENIRLINVWENEEAFRRAMADISGVLNEFDTAPSADEMAPVHKVTLG